MRTVLNLYCLNYLPAIILLEMPEIRYLLNQKPIIYSNGQRLIPII